MSVFRNSDGSILLTDDGNTSRTQLIPPNTPDATVSSMVTTFFSTSKPLRPQLVTMPQLRIAILAAGKLPAVTSAISGGPAVIQILWACSFLVDRDGPLVSFIASTLGADPATDDVFRSAGQLAS